MVDSQSDLTRTEVVEQLGGLVSAIDIITDEAQLREASVDRFRKYTAAHGIYDGPIPAVIVTPATTQQVSAILAFAAEHRVAVVPKTGGTATEGGLETIVADSIVVDGSKMDRIVSVDEANMMATVQCGVRLDDLETALRDKGFTTGHSPQSKPLAQYGGLVATRSIGQFSTYYGAIEDMVVGLEAVLPGGEIVRIKNVPRRAAGPDIRHILIGNEGALAFITEVTLEIFRYYPDSIRYFGYLTDDFGIAVDGLRQLITTGYRPSICRAYSPEDAAQHFEHFAGRKSVVVLSAEGPELLAAATANAIENAFNQPAFERVDPALIEQWFNGLNWGQDKIDAEKRAMLSEAHLGYTTEVSCDWSKVTELFNSVMHRIRNEFPRAADLTMLGGHSSHSYQTGTNLYFVYDYTINCSPRDEIDEYHRPLNAIIVDEALRVGGSMVHHHGVGKYRTGWTRQEHGSAYRLLAGLKREFDPQGIMNPGTIYPLADVEATGSAESPTGMTNDSR